MGEGYAFPLLLSVPSYSNDGQTSTRAVGSSSLETSHFPENQSPPDFSASSISSTSLGSPVMDVIFVGPMRSSAVEIVRWYEDNFSSKRTAYHRSTWVSAPSLSPHNLAPTSRSNLVALYSALMNRPMPSRFLTHHYLAAQVYVGATKDDSRVPIRALTFQGTITSTGGRMSTALALAFASLCKCYNPLFTLHIRQLQSGHVMQSARLTNPDPVPLATD